MSPSGSIRSVTRTIYDDANIGGVHPRKTGYERWKAHELLLTHTSPYPFMYNNRLLSNSRFFSFFLFFIDLRDGSSSRCSPPLSSANSLLNIF